MAVLACHACAGGMVAPKHAQAVRLPMRSVQFIARGSQKRRLAARRAPVVQAAGEVVTDATYQDLVLSCPVPCLLVFWEEKNNHSREYAVEIGNYVATLGYGEKLRTLFVNIEESPVLSEECCVMDVPTMIIFTGGLEREVVRGKVPLYQVADILEKYMAALI